jgi:hypothetical protein
VKRPGSEVHARDGFFGIATTPDQEAKLDSPLLDAVLSPFRYNDLTVNLSSGYIDDPREGILIRAWFHLDGQRLGIAKKEDGGRHISLEAQAVTTDINGAIQDSGTVQKEITVSDDNMPGIIEQGITVPIVIPAKTPGAYYVRVGVKDNISGKMGSAFQYIDIPDLKMGQLSLSDIFVINRDEDASWIQSGMAQKSPDQADPTQEIANRSPALRSYLPGEKIRYMAVIYNATTETGSAPDLESQVVLYRNGSEVFRSRPETVDYGSAGNLKRIPISKELLLDSAMEPGDYVLQLLITDKRAKSHAVAAKALNFEIVKL